MWPVVKRSFVLGVISLAGASVPAYAQFTDILDVKVPFPFIAGHELLPAGSYIIERDADASGALIIRGQNGTNGVAIVSTRPDSSSVSKGKQPSLEFTREENQYKLSHIKVPGDFEQEVH